MLSKSYFLLVDVTWLEFIIFIIIILLSYTSSLSPTLKNFANHQPLFLTQFFFISSSNSKADLYHTLVYNITEVDL